MDDLLQTEQTCRRNRIPEFSRSLQAGPGFKFNHAKNAHGSERHRTPRGNPIRNVRRQLA